MGRLDGGLRRIFGNAFKNIYLDGTLHKATVSFSGATPTASFSDFPIKIHPDILRRGPMESGNEAVSKMLVLQKQLVDDISPAVNITEGDEVSVARNGITTRYLIGSPPESDPAGSHYVLRVRRKGV